MITRRLSSKSEISSKIKGSFILTLYFSHFFDIISKRITLIKNLRTIIKYKWTQGRERNDTLIFCHSTYLTWPSFNSQWHSKASLWVLPFHIFCLDLMLKKIYSQFWRFWIWLKVIKSYCLYEPFQKNT